MIRPWILLAALVLAAPLAADAAVPVVAATGEVPALVDVAWLETHRKDVVVVDLQAPKAFESFHIPGSVNLPYAVWRTHAPKGNKDPSVLESMLPPPARLAAMLGAAGIGDDDHVVIAATGQGAGDLASAARVYWTFKVLGHDAVSVLDGGLVGYAKAGRRLVQGTERRAPTLFKAKLRPDMVPDAAGVQTLIAAGAQPVDARSEGEFVGIYTGDNDERPGTIPGARNLPYDWVTADGSGRMRSPGALRELFTARGIDPEGTQVHFCHSGSRAALTWFASYAVLGNHDAKLYDGSMMEWAQRKDLPIATEIELCDAC
ncbi:MAG: sulfurtransferase [Thiohalocapsa sp.]|jgi:thiosulfate/3-mercaptopyruvate sulfurtransferase|uniref:sulfurtransferase n=1 Tax=Thiohalocapsa sp. TaxID=2497641 RepID=UPI0025CE8EC8|nr:sulfurtransferase [Thiohalocapsa sp.]MCG6942312.1 sulfurtransferase [Thiohalocapsa sp.]